MQPFRTDRRRVHAALRAGRRMRPMIGLLELDVTEAKRLLASHDPPLCSPRSSWPVSLAPQRTIRRSMPTATGEGSLLPMTMWM